MAAARYPPRSFTLHPKQCHAPGSPGEPAWGRENGAAPRRPAHSVEDAERSGGREDPIPGFLSEGNAVNRSLGP